VLDPPFRVDRPNRFLVEGKSGRSDDGGRAPLVQLKAKCWVRWHQRGPRRLSGIG